MVFQQYNLARHYVKMELQILYFRRKFSLQKEHSRQTKIYGPCIATPPFSVLSIFSELVMLGLGYLSNALSLATIERNASVRLS